MPISRGHRAHAAATGSAADDGPVRSGEQPSRKYQGTATFVLYGPPEATVRRRVRLAGLMNEMLPAESPLGNRWGDVRRT